MKKKHICLIFAGSNHEMWLIAGAFRIVLPELEERETEICYFPGPASELAEKVEEKAQISPVLVVAFDETIDKSTDVYVEVNDENGEYHSLSVPLDLKNDGSLTTLQKRAYEKLQANDYLGTNFLALRLVKALESNSNLDGRVELIILYQHMRPEGETNDAPCPYSTDDPHYMLIHTPPFSIGDERCMKPFTPAFRDSLRKLIKNEAESSRKYEGPIIGQSKAINDVRALIQRFAPTDTSLLIQGESGTGKELVAQQIHDSSRRKGKAFIPVNCAAIPKDLVESELFGHEKGAYTGATTQRIGKFELADKGTIFLDEVGELKFDAQSKLLRVLQEKEIERVGGSNLIPVDVRVIAATNKDLRTEVKEGRFRDDLFFRLNDFIISIPPLRDRSSDIRLLIEYFLRKNLEANQPPRSLTSDAMKMLLGYNWPGNVRSLEKVVNASCILSDSEAVDAHIVAAAMSSQPQSVQSVDGTSRTLASIVERVEKAHIQSVLNECEWIKERAIEILGTTRVTLDKKIEKYDLLNPKNS